MGNLADYLGSFKDDFQRGLGIVGNGAQNLAGNFNRGLQVLGDTTANQGVPAAFAQLNQAAGDSIAATLGTAGQVAGLPKEALRASVGLDPHRPMKEDLQDLGMPMDYAAKLGGAVDVLGDPLLAAGMASKAPAAIDSAAQGLANSKAITNVGLKNFVLGEGGGLRLPRTAAEVAADMAPIENQITTVRGAYPSWTGYKAQDVRGPNLTDDSIQGLLDYAREQQAASAAEGHVLGGFYETPSAAQVAAGQPGGRVFTYASTGLTPVTPAQLRPPERELGTFAHEMTHAAIDTANRMGLADSLPYWQRPVAYAAASESPFLRALGEVGDEAIAHGHGASTASGQSGLGRYKAFLGGASDFLSNPDKIQAYKGQFSNPRIDPTGWFAQWAHANAAPIGTGLGIAGAGALGGTVGGVAGTLLQQPSGR